MPGGKTKPRLSRDNRDVKPLPRWSIEGEKAMLTYARCMIRQFVRNEKGATAIEYGLIAALIAIAAVTVMGTVGTSLTAKFQSVADALK